MNPNKPNSTLTWDIFRVFVGNMFRVLDDNEASQ